MTDPDDDFMPPPPRSRFRWMWKLAKWCCVLISVVVVVAYIGRWQVGRIGQRELDATTQRLDADDAGWRLDAILEERKKHEPTPKENAAPVILDLAEQIPQDFRDWQKSESGVNWWNRNPENRLPPPDATVAAQTVAASTRLVRTDALKLRDKRAGIFPLTIKPDPLTTLLPHMDKARQVASLLQYDGSLAAIEKNPNRGISSARAGLGIARAISDEPFLISQLVRIAVAKIAAQNAMQVLAWGEPTDGLTELQAELFAEADVPWFAVGMRGERAMLDKAFQGFADGTIPPESAFSYSGISNPGPQHYALFRGYKALLPGDRAKCLQLCTEYLEASKRPSHEQLDALKKIVIPKGPPDEFRYVVTRLFAPACVKVAEAGLRARADLLAAATCVACERFRRKNGRFPRELAELTPTFLPAVPLSPFDGKLLRYRAYPDRIAVYCFWPDAQIKLDSQHTDFREGDAPGTGIGYRMWNPDQRGLPALVEEKKDP